MKIVLLILMLCSSPLLAQTVTVEAESMTVDPNIGGPDGPGVMVWSAGTLQKSVSIPSATTYRIDVVARGESAQGVNPIMDVRIDGGSLGVPVSVGAVWATYAIATVPLTAGMHSLTIAFTNDYFDGTEDRNLFVDKTEFWFGLAPPVMVQAGKFKLEWDPNAEATLTGYRLYRSEQQDVYGAALGTVTKPATSYQDLTAQPGHTYYYVVTAVANGIESAHSNTVVAVVASPTQPPPTPKDITRPAL